MAKVQEVILSDEEKKALEVKQALLDSFKIKATKENWRVIKFSSTNFRCECLIDGEYQAMHSANSLVAANAKVNSTVDEFKSKIECIDGPVVVLDFSIKEVKPEIKL
jgi:hypothetical protein